MVSIKSVNEIILSLIDYFKLAQPDLDTKPGTVARDLFIDGPSSQIALLYDQLSAVADKSSLRLVVGSDLDKLARNFGITRRQSKTSTGVALLTFSSINSSLNINPGDIITSNTGFSFKVSSGTTVSISAINFYRSVASKFREQLDYVGISDEYAVEVTVMATSPGTSGNISRYDLARTTITGVSNVTNIKDFRGGTDQETDASFRDRVLSSFSGSSVGTNLGYLNTALSRSGVTDAIVIEPGDPLMTRDGTIVKINSDNSRTILSEGSGGKVDVVILGTNIVQDSDSFIFRDKSNNDPTNIKNDFTLGQISGDENKTINRKRIDNIISGVLPNQPINTITQVTGSLSGSNFTAKSIDSLGRVFGNYELIKDTGVYAGSPWGFDKFHWVSNKISLFEEDRIKGQLNGQDSTTFTDVLEIPRAQQSLSIINENSTITTDRSIIQLLHTPMNNVTRVFNVNTGERYIVTSQNYDNTPTYNNTGRIKISGNTLPSTSDTLQVDYNWIVDYDQYSDYDGLSYTSNSRNVTDSIDWGYSSSIKNERILFTLSTGNNFFTGTSSHPINTVISANKFIEVDGVVTKITSGTFVNKLSVTISKLAAQTSSVDSIIFKNTNTELYNTSQNNGSFTNETEVVGIQVLFSTIIILPTDSPVIEGDKVTVKLNKLNVFSSSSEYGNSNNNQITIPSSLVNTSATSISLEVTYIANILDLFSSSTSSLPSSKIGNGYILNNNNGFNNFSPVNILRKENQVVQKNSSNKFYIDLSITNSDFTLTAANVLSVIRLSDSLEIWNSDNIGTLSANSTNNYQLLFNGYNSPASNDMVLVIYYADDIRRFQPFSFNNTVINTRIDTLDFNAATNKFELPLNSIASQSSGVSFSILDPNSNITFFSVTDGYINSNISSATVSSTATNFSTLNDIAHKKLKITGSTNPNNNGIYDIISFDSNTNKITITNTLDKIIKDQVSVIRVLDGKELWSYSGAIDIANNKLTFPVTVNAVAGNKVFVLYFNFKNARKSPTKIIGTTSDQVTNPGVVVINGTSFNKASDIIFTAVNTGLKQNISEAVRKALSLNSSVSIPSNIKLVKLIKLEKVITASSTNDEVLSVLTTYDIKNTYLQSNIYYADEVISNSALLNLDFVLPSTDNNNLNTDIQNLPKIGDKLRITFYYTVENDSENLSYTKNGVLYTNKKFAFINKLFINSGFSTSQSTKFTMTSFTQPSLGARYKVFYDYTAPKQNERILISYDYNKLIADVTFDIESSRPINADVIARQSKLITLDLTMNVVIADSYKSSTQNVLQNLRDQLVSAMTTTVLNGIVDSVTLINVAQSVPGIARARILFFNKTGSNGQVLKLQAQADEYFSPYNIQTNTETR